jgi:hypothetical protein
VGPLASIEMYDPSASSWTSSGLASLSFEPGQPGRGQRSVRFTIACSIDAGDRDSAAIAVAAFADDFLYADRASVSGVMSI